MSSPSSDPVTDFLGNNLKTLVQEAQAEQIQTIIAKSKAERAQLFGSLGNQGGSDGAAHPAVQILNTLLAGGVPPDIATAAVLGRSAGSGTSLVPSEINRDNSSVMNKLIDTMSEDAKQAKDQAHMMLMNRLDELKGSQQTPTQLLGELLNMQAALKQIAGDNESKAAALQPMAASIEGQIHLKQLDIEREDKRAEREAARDDRINNFKIELLKIERMITESDRKWEMEFNESKSRREQMSELLGHVARVADNFSRAVATRLPGGETGVADNTMRAGVGASRSLQSSAPQVSTASCPTCGAEMQFLEGAEMALCPNGNCPQREHTLNWGEGAE